MRKRVKMMVAAAICAVTMFVVGCGNADDKTVPDAVEATTPANPMERYVGEWKLAYIESGGLTFAGDMSGFAQLSGEDVSVTVRLADEGTGTMALGADSSELTWEVVDDDNIKITLSHDLNGEDDESAVLDATYADGELRLDMSGDGTDAAEGEEGVAQDVSEGIMVLTLDGKSDKAQTCNFDEATKIVSKDTLVGDWSLRGIGMLGLYVYGDAEGVGKILGDESAAISFGSDDTCKFFDGEGTYEVGEDGAVVSVEEMGEDIPVLAYGDDIVVDMTAFFGATFGGEEPLFMVYSK